MGRRPGALSRDDAGVARGGVERGRRGVTRGTAGTRCVGTRTRKVEPSPTRLSAVIVPPSTPTSRCTMLRPRPTPPVWRVLLSPICRKASKIDPSSLGGMPDPVSETAMVDPAGLVVRRDGHGDRPLLGELDRVVDEVADDLLQLDAVGLHRRRRLRERRRRAGRDDRGAASRYSDSTSSSSGPSVNGSTCIETAPELRREKSSTLVMRSRCRTE